MTARGWCAIKALTIRNVPASLADALEREKRRKGKSLTRRSSTFSGRGSARRACDQMDWVAWRAAGARTSSATSSGRPRNSRRRLGGLNIELFRLDSSSTPTVNSARNSELPLLLRAQADGGAATRALVDLRPAASARWTSCSTASPDQTERTPSSTSPVVEELPVDAATSRHCAEIVAELRKAGTPSPPTTSGSPPRRAAEWHHGPDP